MQGDFRPPSQLVASETLKCKNDQPVEVQSEAIFPSQFSFSKVSCKLVWLGVAAMVWNTVYKTSPVLTFWISTQR